MTRRPAAALALCFALAAALLARPLGRQPLRLELGGFEGDLIAGAWERADRAELDPQAASDGVTSFYFRPAPANATLRLPVVARGPLLMTLRCAAPVRSGLSVFANGKRVGELLVRPGPWSRYSLEIPAADVPDAALELALALRPLPLVRGDHAEEPRLLLDFVELESAAGLTLSWGGCARVAAVPLLLFGFGLLVGASAWGALAAAGLGGAASAALAHAATFPTFLAVPRLLPVALVAGWLSHQALLRWGRVAPVVASRLALLLAAGTLAHGALVFFPNHNPPDVDIHVRRTLDLHGVPWDYASLLRYGSQLPTASQDQGAATAALGEKTLIPYSPLPYFFYFAFHWLGLDLYWAMTALNAALAMLVAPAMFLVARRVWAEHAAWTAALLYSLDLAVWHHVGRAHAPAAFGNALGTAALLLLAASAETLEVRRRALLVGGFLGVAVLGYSSLVVLFGLFGCVLLGLLALDARGLASAARRGVGLALVVGGLIAGLLFYFHYVPGLLRGASGVEAEPDLFPGKTFFVFHNESRQSLRLWVLGYWLPLLAGLLAAPLALRRARPAARPVLFAWLAAWGLLMLLKEPALFPKLLRWAKEDQFLSPLLCLTVAGACAAPARRHWRVLLTGAALAGALWLEARDFQYHANSLLL